MSTTEPTEQTTTPKQKSNKWWWVAGIICGLVLLGSVIDTPRDMTCSQLNAEMDAIRAENTRGGMIVPFAQWDQDDLDRMRELIGEVTDRQNRGENCRIY